MKIITAFWAFVCFSAGMAQNIGINTPTPNAALDVRSTGSTSATFGVLVSNNTNDTSLVVSDNGNVGIGTTLPAYTLDVQSSNPIAARFSGRVTGQNAVNGNEFITLQQASTLGGSGTQATPTMFSTESTTTYRYGGAAMYCRTLTEGSYTNWRLPTLEEMLEMLQTDAIPLPTLTTNRTYWLFTKGSGVPFTSSTYDYLYSPAFVFTGNYNTSHFKMIDYTNASHYVLCVR